MAALEMTEELAHAAANDAANRQMRRAGRTAWSAEDFDLAVNTFEQLYGWSNPNRKVNRLCRKLGYADSCWPNVAGVSGR